MNRNFRIYPLAEYALTVQYPPEIDVDLVRHLGQLKKVILRAEISGIERVEVALYELTVFYDPLILSFEKISRMMKAFLKGEELLRAEKADRHPMTLPVCYDEVFAPDKSRVEDFTGLRFEEIIARHCNEAYSVLMIGFLPGFLYLGGLDEKLVCPRLPVPRKKVHSGSVGIGGGQTGIYPVESPGGWNIIGRMPLRLFDWQKMEKSDKSSGVTIQILDIIRFEKVSREVYEEWCGRSLKEYIMAENEGNDG